MANVSERLAVEVHRTASTKIGQNNAAVAGERAPFGVTLLAAVERNQNAEMVDAVCADSLCISGVIEPGHVRPRHCQIAKAEGFAGSGEVARWRQCIEHRRKARPLAAVPGLIGIAPDYAGSREEAEAKKAGCSDCRTSEPMRQAQPRKLRRFVFGTKCK